MAICKTCKSHFDQLHLNSIICYLEYKKTGECQKCQDKRKQQNKEEVEMNKELMRLLELIKTLVKQEVLDEEFNSFAEDLKENENVTVKELIEMMETEISYWEKD